MSNECNDLWDVSLHDLRAVYDPEMHLSMLRDCRRHEFYDQCLARRISEVRGKVVIDVGAGTGILSALAARGGAAQVHAVEALVAERRREGGRKEGKGREGKGREGKGGEGRGREGKVFGVPISNIAPRRSCFWDENKRRQGGAKGVCTCLFRNRDPA
ncbi:Protein arginine N-methyltransferase 6 [Symbiodinium microadriaticum]|uniref:Protein arginine N-methyltransferase 6 n=1 Tax=Symbiodinium microadriaticum TaxID=2951 RepID=A0A1Q9D6F3_SYMMI|nr:Protein arginine N-methyltransferase 6 [Symbiodinium microadriaticum]